MGGWVDKRQNTIWPLPRTLAGTVGIFFFAENVWVCVCVCSWNLRLPVSSVALRAFTLVLRHITRSHTNTPLAYININTWILCSVSGELYCLENVRQSSVHLPSKRRDVNNSTTLSAGECRCMHGHTERKSVGQREMDGESGERVTQLKWTLEQRRGQSWTNAGHLCSTEESVYTHANERKRGGKSERSTFICTNTTSSSSCCSWFTILPLSFYCPPLFFLHQSSSQTNSRSDINNGAQRISLFNIQRGLPCCHFSDE